MTNPSPVTTDSTVTSTSSYLHTISHVLSVTNPSLSRVVGRVLSQGKSKNKNKITKKNSNVGDLEFEETVSLSKFVCGCCGSHLNPLPNVTADASTSTAPPQLPPPSSVKLVPLKPSKSSLRSWLRQVSSLVKARHAPGVDSRMNKSKRGKIPDRPARNEVVLRCGYCGEREKLGCGVVRKRKEADRGKMMMSKKVKMGRSSSSSSSSGNSNSNSNCAPSKKNPPPPQPPPHQQQLWSKPMGANTDFISLGPKKKKKKKGGGGGTGGGESLAFLSSFNDD